MKKLLFLLLNLMLVFQVIAVDYQAEFEKYFSAEDTVNQVKTLEAWKQAKPDDPEWYTSQYNYYFNKARKEGLLLTAKKPNGESISFKDSLKTVGFITVGADYDLPLVKKGLAVINEGIKKYPNRLDMRFGKIYALGEIEDWEGFTKEAIAAVNYSKTNSNKWLWTDNEKVKDAKAFFLDAMHSYQIQLYNTEADSLIDNMQQLAKAIVSIYPDHVETLSNLSITYVIQEKFENAINVLRQAEAIAPKDFVVLSNLALAYKSKGDKPNAIAYYKKVVKYGDEEAKAYAQEQLVELNSN